MSNFGELIITTSFKSVDVMGRKTTEDFSCIVESVGGHYQIVLPVILLLDQDCQMRSFIDCGFKKIPLTTNWIDLNIPRTNISENIPLITHGKGIFRFGFRKNMLIHMEIIIPKIEGDKLFLIYERLKYQTGENTLA